MESAEDTALNEALSMLGSLNDDGGGGDSTNAGFAIDSDDDDDENFNFDDELNQLEGIDLTNHSENNGDGVQPVDTVMEGGATETTNTNRVVKQFGCAYQNFR